MNPTCNACNIKIDINNYKKKNTKSCYNRNKRKNKTIVSYQQPKIENGNDNNNNGTLLVGTSFSGKTYLMLKIFSRVPNRDIYKITKSPPEHYSNSKNQNEEKGDEIKPLSRKTVL